MGCKLGIIPAVWGVEKTEMRQYFMDEGFCGEEAGSFVNRLSLDKDRWLKAHHPRDHYHAVESSLQFISESACS